MSRPPKWKSPTTAIRVPEQYADELLKWARQWDAGEGVESFVQNPSIDAQAEALADSVIARCEASGIDPKQLLLQLKLHEVREFLSHYRKQDRLSFVVQLLDESVGSDEHE